MIIDFSYYFIIDKSQIDFRVLKSVFHFKVEWFQIDKYYLYKNQVNTILLNKWVMLY